MVFLNLNSFLAKADEENRIERAILAEKESHPPLLIDGNVEFEQLVLKEGWIGNGSHSNPYIIDGLTIEYYYGRILINIRNTDVYFQVSNCNLNLGFHGILLNNVTNAYITNNIFTNNGNGIILIESFNNTIIDNVITDSEENGIYLIFSEENTLITNQLSNNGNTGIYIEASPNNRLVGNSLLNNSLQIWRYLAPYTLPQIKYFQQDVINNTINNKPIIYWINRSDEIVPKGVGQVFLINCTFIEVLNHHFKENSGGLIVVFSSNIKINNNEFSDGTNIVLQNTKNSTLMSNKISYSDAEGISIFNSLNCIVSRNVVTKNRYNGIFLSYSEEITLFDNIVYIVYENWDGIILSNSNRISLITNDVSRNHNYGIFLFFSDNNNLIENSLTENNEYGLYISHFSKNNSIQNSTFYENHAGDGQAADDGLKNSFVYNFWSDWVSPDDDGNGIVDFIYVIGGDANNSDSFPLVALSYSTVPRMTTFIASSTLFLIFASLLAYVLIKNKSEREK
jgi:parallel beta-helix repeat protein